MMELCYFDDAETAVEDELQKRLSQLDNVTTANRLFSFTTSQCSTASEICTLLSPKEKSFKDQNHSTCSVQVRENGDCQRMMQKIHISRPKQWTEQKVNGGKLGLRACTPTRKSTMLTKSASSRKKSCSNLNEQGGSGDSILVSHDDSAPTWHTCSFDSQVSSSQFARRSSPDGVRSYCSLYSCKNENHTRKGVPSPPYASSSIRYTTSSVPVSSMISAEDSLGGNVGIIFERGDAQVKISLSASMNGDNLHAMGIDAV
ncbi:unnamed protein product [Cylicocyclus nassatus]|uniref:Uncharacterized protein n=1 Tax=Cylicocyclus nassatus TaxID=53992 RepID=A0AA36DN75_CYLNA|nr:unnamed protein product [Cylicocyclus nassatus]